MLVGLAKLPALERALPGPQQVGPKIARWDLVDKGGCHLRSVAVVVLVCVYAQGARREESEVVGEAEGGEGRVLDAKRVQPPAVGLPVSVLSDACCPCRAWFVRA